MDLYKTANHHHRMRSLYPRDDYGSFVNESRFRKQEQRAGEHAFCFSVVVYGSLGMGLRTHVLLLQLLSVAAATDCRIITSGRSVGRLSITC